MKIYKKQYELKNAAKDKLDGKYSPAMLICLYASLLTGCFSLIVDPFVPETSSMVLFYVTQGVISLILSWLLGIFDLGLTYFFLNAACGRNYSTGNLFYCFQNDTAKTLTISGVRAIVSTVCILPARYIFDVFWYTHNLSMLAAAGIAAVIGFGIYLYAGLGVTLSFFLQLDFPDKSAQDILRQSFQLIHGHRKRLFLLQLSFLPLMLLCICSLFVGFLWLEPYMQMTYTCFFLDLMNPREV